MYKFNTHREHIKHHHWSNNPNKGHCICTICRCKRDMVSSRGVTRYIYTDKYGNILDECPNCKTINL